MADKLSWQSLKADDTSLPEKVREAIATYEMARDSLEDALREAKPAPKGKRWVFGYKFGASVALANTNGAGKVNYFA